MSYAEACPKTFEKETEKSGGNALLGRPLQ
jgi:hypothetical protein